jgi:hypothetical protein
MWQRGYLLTAFLIMLMAPLATALTGAPLRTVAHYKVSSKGFTIGDVTTTQRLVDESGMSTVNFETKTTVKASFLWMGFHLDTIEKGTLLKGDLVNYSRKGRDNGAVINIEGRLDQSNFRFDVHEQGVTRSIIIPRSSYDFTTMECPEAHLDFSKNAQITLNILDVEKMVVVKREYRLVRMDHYSVAGKEYPCRVVDYADLNKKARRWINYDGAAIVMYRQDSRGGKDSYSVQATSVVKEL